MATTGQRATQEREGRSFAYPMKGATSINRGAIAVLEAGLLVPGKTGTGLAVVGISSNSVSNAGADGDASAETRLGTFLFNNSTSSDLIAVADIGNACFLVDDETVAKTNGGDPATRSRAGIVRGVEEAGVWVELDGRRS